MTQETNILLRNGFVPMPYGDCEGDNSLDRLTALATVAGNLSYYGYAINAVGFEKLRGLSVEQLGKWWPEVEAELKEITGESKKMGKFVVYKNFPGEMLEKSEAEYWGAQVLMYWGLDYSFFAQEAEPRPEMKKMPKAKVLQLATPLSLGSIYNGLLSSTARWKKQELKDALFLSSDRETDFGRVSFKENLVKLCKHFIDNGKTVTVKTATDVLRLAAGLSGGDVSLREKFRFKKFPRKERRFMLGMLENCKNMEEDFARRPELWKRLLHGLHVGDYAKNFPNVVHANNLLYNDDLQTFNSNVEQLVEAKNEEALELLKTRPGEFLRRLVHMTDVFGFKAAKAFGMVLGKLTTSQLVSIRRHLETANARAYRLITPKGNWNKMKYDIEPRRVKPKISASISNAIGEELKNRLHDFAPRQVDELTELVKLPTNDGEVSPYAQGTVFPIPENVTFIRTASYWKVGRRSTMWFDNGWNFFDTNWNPVGTCCWNHTHNMGEAAVFSGDPVSGGEMKGRAAQMIDIYPEKLRRKGVRYAVWNILCYSGVPFSGVEEVFAALQWGENPTTGNLFEPSRCQLAFPLNGDSLTKYVAYIDLETNEMVYMDANLLGNVHSAGSNLHGLREKMPVLVDYYDSLPTVYDLFKDAENKKTGKGFVLYSDADVELDGERAYVFKSENKENKFKKIELNDLLSMKRT